MGNHEKKPRQLTLFEDHETLPLFSGTAPRAAIDPFVPEPALHQGHLPGMQPDWTELARALSRAGGDDSAAPLRDALEQDAAARGETGEHGEE